MIEKSIIIAFLILFLVLGTGCSPGDSLPNNFTPTASSQYAAPEEIQKGELLEGYSHTVFLAPAIFDAAGKYLGDYTLHSMGYRYGDIIFTSSANIKNAEYLIPDSEYRTGFQSGEFELNIISIESFFPFFSYEILESASLDFSDDFPKNLQDKISAFKNASPGSEDKPRVSNYSDSIDILDEVFVIGQIRIEDKFYLVRRPARITAISSDGYSFLIQGSVSFHDMGGTVMWKDENGNEVPIGIVIEKRHGAYESEATAITISSLVEGVSWSQE